MLIGKRLREARLLAGASQAQLAGALGVAVQAVQRYESGARRLTAARLVAAVRFLGVPMSFLFKEEKASLSALENAGLTATEIELLQSFRAIASDGLRAQVLQMAKAASEEAPSAE